MRILWASNYTSHSAYSSQARLAVKVLVELGHEVSVLNLSLGSYGTNVIDGITVYPVARDSLGNDVLPYYAAETEADAVITLVDAFGISPETMAVIPGFPWVPVDHVPIVPSVTGTIRAARRPIAMSKFGYIQMQQAGFDPLYVPHAFDPSVFSPLPMDVARATLGWDPEDFTVLFLGVNDSNPSRKGIPELLMAWKQFERRHPDVRLHMHTSEYGNMHQSPMSGVNISQLNDVLGLKSMTLVDQGAYYQGMPQSYLAYLYSATDWLILPSRGEGFGVPLIEAQACGCPVLVTDFAAQRELAANDIRIQGESEWSPFGSFRYRPSVVSIINALEQAYSLRHDRMVRMKAYDFSQQYTIGNVKQQWRVALAGIEETNGKVQS